MDFESEFERLTDFKPLRWQTRLYTEYLALGILPTAVDIPTGLGKTSVMALWYLAFKAGARLPRRLVYVVDRRAVVDQATTIANKIKTKSGDDELKISTLRGQFVDNREWLEDPARPAIIVGTVDMIGSRLLFEGYGVSRKMRPYHAGLLGADTLVLLDEAHLVPPFEALLAEIAGNAGRYGEKADACNALVPKFQLLPLSATGRRQTARPFALEEKDFRNPDDAIAIERLSAKKRLTLQDRGDRELKDALAEQAWALSGDGAKPVRVIVYCDKRDVAEKVKGELDKKARNTAAKDNIELFVGARRVKERTDAEKQLKKLGFLAGSGEQTAPAFLVATSAGEVGVDLDADHMVCDLVAWERMVQRFGRVNRRGGKDKKGEERQAEIVVLLKSEPKLPELKANADDKARKKHEAALEKHNKEVEGFRKTRKPFGEALQKQQDGSFDVSPESLRQLSVRASADEKLAKLVADASSPTPLRPALNRALVDAWAMTSLPEHTGRPEIAPWLRGWVDEIAQTAVAWRKHLPVRDKPTVNKKEIEDFFEAAPLHASETLETESWRVFEWLKKRAAMLDKISDDQKTLKSGDVVAMILKMDGSWVRSLKLGDLLSDKKNKDKEKFLESIERDIQGKTLVMDVRFGGLRDGLLKDDATDMPPTTDDGTEWMPSSDGKPVIRFRVLASREESDEDANKEWRESLRFDLERNADGEASRWLSVQKWRDTSNNENDRAAGRPQALAEHQSWAADKAKDIARRLALPQDYINALCIAARLHDEGKKGRNWKRTFNVERYAKELGIPGQPLAKTPRFNWKLLEGYRHEFGSLPYAKDDAEFQNLSPELQDLVLHLIAAHHGFARPLISIKGGEAPDSVLEERAREVALRFARLQKRWGAWGLAWWESLLRAADAQASRANDERSD